MGGGAWSGPLLSILVCSPVAAPGGGCLHNVRRGRVSMWPGQYYIALCVRTGGEREHDLASVADCGCLSSDLIAYKRSHRDVGVAAGCLPAASRRGAGASSLSARRLSGTAM